MFIRDYAGEIPGIMKAFALFVVFVVSAQAADEYCYRDVVWACTPTASKQGPTSLHNCNARYGAIDTVQSDLQAYVNTHIAKSFEYLLMSTHYANYEKNRAGFEKLYRSLSDSKWDTAIELIKYITKRGGDMDFNRRKDDIINADGNGNFEVYEIASLAKALDTEKSLASEAFNIHREATRNRQESHDPEISSYIEEEFVHKHADTIRKLSGFTTDLSSLLRGPDSSLALFLFDEYLQKQ